MIRLMEILGIIGLTGLSYIGIVIAQGGKKSAIVISVLVSIGLVIFNAKLEDETGKGIVGNIYCGAVICKAKAASITEAPLVPSVPSGPSCDQQIAAWNVRLSDYRQQETQRAQRCADVESAQVSLNSEFFELKTEWPIAMSFMKDCIKNQTAGNSGGKDNPMTCMDAVCIGAAIGGYDCAPLQKTLRSIYNRQEEYIQIYRANACTMNADSDYFEAMGMVYTKPASAPPAAPDAPECLAKSGNMPHAAAQ